MPSYKKNIAPALVLLILLGLIWGSGYSIAKYATEHGVPPLGYAFWQSLGPAIVMLCIVLAQKQFLPLNKKHLRYYFITGLLGIALPNTIMYGCAAHLPAGILAVIVNTVPIMTYPLALLVNQEHFHWPRFAGVCIGLMGITFIIVPHASFSAALHWRWALTALLSPFCFALCAIYINHDRPQDSSITLATGMLIASSILLTPIVFISHHFYPLVPPFTTSDFIVLLEILLSSIGYVLFFTLVRTAGAVYYSLVGGVVALTGLFWGRIIFHEQLNIINSLAVICILTAIVLVSMSQTRKRT